jgi:hypothetical protein
MCHPTSRPRCCACLLPHVVSCLVFSPPCVSLLRPCVLSRSVRVVGRSGRVVGLAGSGLGLWSCSFVAVGCWSWSAWLSWCCCRAGVKAVKLPVHSFDSGRCCCGCCLSVCPSCRPCFGCLSSVVGLLLRLGPWRAFADLLLADWELMPGFCFCSSSWPCSSSACSPLAVFLSLLSPLPLLLLCWLAVFLSLSLSLVVSGAACRCLVEKKKKPK